MDVRARISKELFSNPMNGYRVLSCDPLDYYSGLKLNKYGNFTISGDNIGRFDTGDEIYMNIAPDNESKYPASYKYCGLGGIEDSINRTGEISLNKEQSIAILSSFMTSAQVQNIMEGCPDFVNLVLSNRSKEIDVAKIYNVGNVRLEKYIAEIQKECEIAKYLPVMLDWGIDISFSHKLSEKYESAKELSDALIIAPYDVFISTLHYPFLKADDKILSQYPHFAESKQRCEYALVYALDQIEEEGDTWGHETDIREFFAEYYPECQQRLNDVMNLDLFHHRAMTGRIGKAGLYKAELEICNRLYSLIHTPHVDLNWNPYITVDGFTLTEEQQQVLTIFQDTGVAILTAPAGAGKTSSMKGLIRMLEGNVLTYTMVAPTGAAAKVLSQTTGRKASTIHRRILHSRIETDFLIIEEASMVGVDLMESLLSCTSKRTKILFICDPSQLPSISPGNMVHDIIKSKVIPHISLTKIFRYNTSGLVTIATDTRYGRADNLTSSYPDYSFIESDDIVDQVCEIYGELINEYGKEDVLVLSPFNVGKAGSIAINNAIQSKFNPNPETPIIINTRNHHINFRIGDRIINKKNVYDRLIYDYDAFKDFEVVGERGFVPNGAIGIMLDYGEENGRSFVYIQFDDGIYRFDGTEISNLRLGYAISVHSSQGNQAKAVIVAIASSHVRMLNRNLEYVAFTRAQEKLVVIGRPEPIIEAMANEETSTRNTWLYELLTKRGEDNGNSEVHDQGDSQSFPSN